MTRSSLQDWFVVYLKGFCMGIADTIPGVSGGTIALIVGIYDRLITAISALDPTIVFALPHLRDPNRRATVRARLTRMDIGFLAALGLGIVTAVIVFSGLTAHALETYQAPTNAFFFGLIGASAIVLSRDMELNSAKRILTAIGGVLIAYVVTGVTASNGLSHSLPVVFLSGMITSTAMLLPGISGAAFLYLLGQYEFLVGALYDVLGALSSPDTVATVVPSGITVSVFLAGFGVGVITIAHIIAWALRTDRSTTLTLLVSLMIGALRLPIEVIQAETTTWSLQTTIAISLAAVVGIVIVLVLDYFTDDLTYT